MSTLPDTSHPERIAAFCAAEVTRQGHNIFHVEDGGVRLAGMLAAWRYASILARRRPKLEDVLQIAALVEPRNKSGWRTCGVRVGSTFCPPWQEVPEAMERLWSRTDNLPLGADARTQWDEAYLSFQKIHPFVDGNGRTGKILHNWWLQTLDSPVLVADFFGHGNP